MGDGPTEAVLARLRSALDAADESLIVLDSDGRVTEVNSVALRLSHREREDVLGRSLVDIAIGDGADLAELEAIRRAVAGVPTRYVAVRGEHRTLVTATPLEDGGAVLVSQGVAAYREQDARTLRARLLGEAARALSDPAALDATLEALADLMVPGWADSCLCALVEPDGSVRPVASRNEDPAVLAAALRMLPSSVGDIVPGGLLDQAVSSGTPVVIEDVGAASLPPASAGAVQAFKICSLAIAPLVEQDELVGLLVLATTTESGRRLREAELEVLTPLADRTAAAVRAARLHAAARAAEARFRAAFEQAPIGIALSSPDEDGTLAVDDANAAFCAIVGQGPDELIGRPLGDVVAPDVSGETSVARPDGIVRHVLAGSAPTGDGDVVTQLLDVSDRHRAQTELEHLASHDALTGLLNRRRFEDGLEEELAQVRRFGDEAAVLTLDVDNFKHINDHHGHAAGDAVLRAIADTLRQRTRATDRVGRLGGDEFGVVLARSSPEDAHRVAGELLSAIRALRVPFGEHRLRATISIGVRTLAQSESHHADVLLSEADMAMYDAKENGRDCLAIISKGDVQPERVRARRRWTERIRDAVESPDGFVLFEQPIMRLSDGALDRSELLLRMRDEQGEIVGPHLFLPVAGRYGQMQAVDRWVIRSALQLLRDRTAAGHGGDLEINLSGESLSDPRMADFAVREIEAAGVDASRLIFEVTETSAIGNLEASRSFVARLTALGCGFALDDFGAGFSSFAYLKALPLGIVKIDGQFVRGLRGSRHDRITVRAMVDVARGLGKQTVAEFVEDEATLELLRSFGVDFAQGYHVGIPAPATVVPAFLLQR